MNISFEPVGMADRNVTVDSFKENTPEEIVEYIRSVLYDLAEDVFLASEVEEEMVPVTTEMIVGGILESWFHRDGKALIAAFDALKAN